MFMYLILKGDRIFILHVTDLDFITSDPFIQWYFLLSCVDVGTVVHVWTDTKMWTVNHDFVVDDRRRSNRKENPTSAFTSDELNLIQTH